ncbi:hypothetical protein KBX20_11115 [Lactobacillus helveticus]|uniref:Uncharacterized protein n=1 Tax=Lactobacillus helveticus TaxID=1587 RepID=A0A8H9F6I1_LACHE|nr:hypothetical protein [Lactobacillus helveticus]MCJ2191238.1 hypothetical protein [Lactobacillus helveticus]MCO0808454.1 hypothetical protein [Lactobacillus helveticus]MCP9318115.1 hypothetical protein [Lactobacillus helveticus]MZR06735.1 hypothetical protein [Lactobacillus helveticus]GFO98438.1 hypothetical protein LHEH8_01940 [Lactobacillus helveticus]
MFPETRHFSAGVVHKDKRDNAELSVTWDNKTVWTYGLFDRNKGKTIAFQIS